MFVVEITYLRPLDDVERHIEEHRQFLKQHYAEGTFLMSGAKVPRDGGVIIANGNNPAELEAILAADPFAIHNVASYRLVQFEARVHQLENFIG